MRVLHLSIYDTKGGASKAAYRIHRALLKAGIESDMLVLKKYTKDDSVIEFKTSPFMVRLRNKLNRMALKKTLRPDKEFSVPFYGVDVTSHPLVKKADVIHLHWVNGGFISLSSLKKLSRLKKKIIWTSHDCWSFTGGCHYTGDCKNYITGCGNCPELLASSKKDLSAKILNAKKSVFKLLNITMVSCSTKLRDMCQESYLFKDKVTISIPNPIDTTVFRHSVRIQSKKKFILFGSPVDYKRKGWDYFVDALSIFEKNNPELASFCEVVLFGNDKLPEVTSTKIKINLAGFIKDDSELVRLFNMGSVFAAPSLEDNLPNTILEALSCGLPALSFNTGGIPDLIIHKENGYLAEYKNSADLATGLEWCLTNKEVAGKKAIERVNSYFNEEVVSSQYLKVYRER